MEKAMGKDEKSRGGNRKKKDRRNYFRPNQTGQLHYCVRRKQARGKGKRKGERKKKFAEREGNGYTRGLQLTYGLPQQSTEEATAGLSMELR